MVARERNSRSGRRTRIAGPHLNRRAVRHRSVGNPRVAVPLEPEQRLVILEQRVMRAAQQLLHARRRQLLRAWSALVVAISGLAIAALGIGHSWRISLGGDLMALLSILITERDAGHTLSRQSARQCRALIDKYHHRQTGLSERRAGVEYRPSRHRSEDE